MRLESPSRERPSATASDQYVRKPRFFCKFPIFNSEHKNSVFQLDFGKYRCNALLVLVLRLHVVFSVRGWETKNRTDYEVRCHIPLRQLEIRVRPITVVVKVRPSLRLLPEVPVRGEHCNGDLRLQPWYVDQLHAILPSPV